MLASCTGLPLPTATAPAAEEIASEAPLHYKDAAPFVDHGDGNLEARLENMQGVITPSRFFFVRNNSVSLDVEAGAWRLSVGGDAVATLELANVSSI